MSELAIPFTPFGTDSGRISVSTALISEYNAVDHMGPLSGNGSMSHATIPRIAGFGKAMRLKRSQHEHAVSN
jgi:hypothetical protein